MILTRQSQKVFASGANADQIAVFGSMKTGTPVYSSDLATLQSNEYLQGWADAILNDKAPYLEEMNAVQYGLSYQIAYLLQEGIPEYDTGTNYSKTSIVKIVEDNNLVLYHSLIDNNQGVVDITTSADWARLYIVDYGRIGEPQITLNATKPDNCIWLDGSAVSRTTYSALFAIYGTTYGAGDGSTTFNLPDFTDRAIWGANSFGYIAAGLPNIKAHWAVDNRKWIAGAVYTDGSNHEGATGESGLQFHARFDASIDAATASQANGIYRDDCYTVQPPAIKVRVYTRWK